VTTCTTSSTWLTNPITGSQLRGASACCASCCRGWSAAAAERGRRAGPPGRWPGRAPGHSSAGIAISRLTRQVRHRWCRRPALLPWLSSSPQSGAPEIIPAG
jgi:hypothetical protein